MPARILRICIRFRVNRVIAVARVNRINRHQRQPAQILALAKRCHHAALRLGHHRIGKLIRDAMLMDRNQTDRPRARRIAQPRGDPRLWQTDLTLARQFALDQLAVPGPSRRIPRHAPFLVRPLVDRQNPTALGRATENPQHLERIGPQSPDQPRLVIMILCHNLGQPRQYPAALTQSRIALLRLDQNAKAILDTLFQGPRKQIAIAIRCQHLQHRHRRQRARFTVGPHPFFDDPLALQLAQQALKVNARVALDLERVGNVALGRFARIVGDPLPDLVFAGKGVHGFPVA